MEARYLGRTGLRVSPLALGTMTFAGTGRFAAVGSVQVDEAREFLAMAIDAGVNLVDTADVYSLGAAEEVLGQAMAGRRDDLLIATKCGFRLDDDPNAAGSSRYHIIRACEASLSRLGTDHVDLFQVHSVDEHTEIEETLEALDDLVRTGKTRYVGCSNFSAWRLMKALARSEAGRRARFGSLQAYYSLVSRDVEWELMPLCLDQGLGLLVWSPLAGGFLSGKFARGEDAPGDTRRSKIPTPGLIDDDHGFAIVDVLGALAAERGVSMAQVAINWALQRPAVSSVIVGARTR
ncbi:MAG: aldo/keto reductase, partial [Gaiellales bacterium]